MLNPRHKKLSQIIVLVVMFSFGTLITIDGIFNDFNLTLSNPKACSSFPCHNDMEKFVVSHSLSLHGKRKVNCHYCHPVTVGVLVKVAKRKISKIWNSSEVIAADFTDPMQDKGEVIAPDERCRLCHEKENKKFIAPQRNNVLFHSNLDNHNSFSCKNCHYSKKVEKHHFIVKPENKICEKCHS